MSAQCPALILQTKKGSYRTTKALAHSGTEHQQTRHKQSPCFLTSSQALLTPPSVRSNFPRLCSGSPTYSWHTPYNKGAWGTAPNPQDSKVARFSLHLSLALWGPHSEGIHVSLVLLQSGRHSLVGISREILGRKERSPTWTDVKM